MTINQEVLRTESGKQSLCRPTVLMLVTSWSVPGTSVAISNCDGLVRLLAFCVCVFAGVWERSMTSAWLEGRGGMKASLLYFKFREKH